MKKTSPAAMPAIYLDALKAAYARIQPAGADCERKCWCSLRNPFGLLADQLWGVWLHAPPPCFIHVCQLPSVFPSPSPPIPSPPSFLLLQPTPADDDQEVPPDVQEFFSLSDRIAKTYAGFNSSGGRLLHCEWQACPPFIRESFRDSMAEKHAGFNASAGWALAGWLPR